MTEEVLQKVDVIGFFFLAGVFFFGRCEFLS